METYTQRVNREDEIKHQILNILEGYNRKHPHDTVQVSFGEGIKFHGCTSHHYFTDVYDAHLFAISFFGGCQPPRNMLQ